MAYFPDTDYKKYLLPKRLIFLDLDGTIIPSTSAHGRRISIALRSYKQVQEFCQQHLQITELPEINQEQCSQWYREHGGPQGLFKRILKDSELPEELASCLGFYFNGIFSKRLTQYLQEDLAYDVVPEAHLKFLHELSKVSTMVLVSYRWQNQFEFQQSIERLKLTEQGLFGPNNAFAVGQPGSSSDGSKSRFVSSKWRHEIRAQRRLTSNIGKTFPPITLGDSIRDIHFTIDIGSIFFGVSETGEDSSQTLVNEFEKQSQQLHIRSRIFTSLDDKELQRRLLEECEGYMTEIVTLSESNTADLKP